MPRGNTRVKTRHHVLSEPHPPKSWVAAVRASGHLRVLKGVTVRLGISLVCTSVRRLAWARANGLKWVTLAAAERLDEG